MEGLDSFVGKHARIEHERIKRLCAEGLLNGLRLAGSNRLGAKRIQVLLDFIRCAKWSTGRDPLQVAAYNGTNRSTRV